MTKVDKNSSGYISSQRDKNAGGGFLLKGAVWLLSRFSLTKNRYQNWTKGRRILVGWLLWLLLLPIIPAVALFLWWKHDPEGFKKSPYAKALMGLFVIWLGYFGAVATNPSQIDANGKYSPIQTAPNGEKSTATDKPASVATVDSTKKVASQSKSNDSKGKKYENCTEAFNDGVFDIKRSNSSYQNKLDRDNDGIACER